MPKGRTRRGTPIRSTLGMRNIKPQRAWVMVADRHRLCLFERVDDELGERFKLSQEFLNPDGRKKGHELVSDRPGRSFESHDQSHHGQTGGLRHSYGNSFEPEDRAVETLVKEASRLVTDGALNNAETKLTVVAEPRLMGNLRPRLGKVAPQCEMEFKEKDYAWIADDRLEERLKALLS